MTMKCKAILSHVSSSILLVMILPVLLLKINKSQEQICLDNGFLPSIFFIGSKIKFREFLHLQFMKCYHVFHLYLGIFCVSVTYTE